MDEIKKHHIIGLTPLVLIIGYGNPGRLDDGLGPAFAERMAEMDLPDLTVESGYQLQVEDADLLARFDVVVFADASVSAEPPFEFAPLERQPPMVGFSSHSITAASLLGLANHLFQARPEAWMLGIRGVLFDDFGEKLSGEAIANLDAAVAFFVDWLARRRAA